MTQKIKLLISKFNYESTAITVFLLSIITGGINYLFQIATGRLFSPEIFGKISVLLSVIALISSLGTSLMKSMAVKTASLDKESTGKLLYSVPQKTLIFLPFVYLIFGIATYILTRSVFTSFLFFLACFPLTLSFCFEGVLQGTGRVIPVQVCEIIAALCKFIFILLFLKIGLGQLSVPLYSIITNVLLFLFVVYLLKKNDIKVIKNKDEKIKKETLEVCRHYVPSLISVLSLAFFNYLDILTVKFFFDDYQVGQYSSASLFGKIILYIPSALVLILIPSIASSGSKENSLKTLRKTLGYSISLSLIASVALYVLKKPLVVFLMGEKYLPCLSLFIPVCAMMIALVIYTVLINYELAVSDKRFVTVFSIISVLASIIAVACVHQSISACLYALALVYLVSSIILGIRAETHK